MKRSSITESNSRNVINSLFENLKSKSKSPHGGFKELRQSLEKEKQNIHANPPPRYKDAKNSRVRGLSKSDIKAYDIFTHPPNSNVPYRNYEGEVVKRSK